MYRIDSYQLAKAILDDRYAQAADRRHRRRRFPFRSD